MGRSVWVSKAAFVIGFAEEQYTPAVTAAPVTPATSRSLGRAISRVSIHETRRTPQIVCNRALVPHQAAALTDSSLIHNSRFPALPPSGGGRRLAAPDFLGGALGGNGVNLLANARLVNAQL